MNGLGKVRPSPIPWYSSVVQRRGNEARETVTDSGVDPYNCLPSGIRAVWRPARKQALPTWPWLPGCSAQPLTYNRCLVNVCWGKVTSLIGKRAERKAEAPASHPGLLFIVPCCRENWFMLRTWRVYNNCIKDMLGGVDAETPITV